MIHGKQNGTETIQHLADSAQHFARSDPQVTEAQKQLYREMN